MFGMIYLTHASTNLVKCDKQFTQRLKDNMCETCASSELISHRGEIRFTLGPTDIEMAES